MPTAMVTWGFAVSIIVMLFTNASAEELRLEELQSAVAQLQHQARYTEAIRYAERLVVVTESTFGKDSAESAEVVGRIGLLHKYSGNYDRAEHYYTLALQMLDKLPERGGPYRSVISSNLGMLYLEMKRYPEAEPLLSQALESSKTELAGDPNLAFAYNNLGVLYFNLGKYDEALRLLETALKIRQAAPGVDRDLIAISQDNLGQLYLKTGRLSEAEQHFVAALATFRKILGNTHPDTLICVQNLSSVYERTGDMRKALDLLTGAIDATIKVGHESNWRLGRLLKRRGQVHFTSGAYKLAEADWRRALSIADSSGRGSDDVAPILLALSDVYIALDDQSKGDSILERADQLPDRKLVASLYSHRARRELERSRQNESARFLRKAIAIREESNVDDGALADDENALGFVLERLGDTEKAEAAFRRAVQLSERLWGIQGPNTIIALTNLGLLLAISGREDEALEAAEARAAAFEKELINLLSSGTVRERHEFVRNQNPFSLFGTIGRAAPLARAIFKYKGVVTDAEVSMSDTAGVPLSHEQKEALERQQEARRLLTQMSLEDSTRPRESAKTRRDIRDRVEAQLTAAQVDLARLSSAAVEATNTFKLDVVDIQARIPPNAALLDFVRYSHYLGASKHEDRYGVIVLAAHGEPQWVPLGKAWDIEQVVAVLQRVVRGADPVNTIKGTLRHLYDVLIDPVIKVMPPGTKKILLSPDGDLAFVSFAALLATRERFLIEDYSVTYLTSARDLLRTESRPAVKTAQIYANPKFRLQTMASVQPRSSLKGFQPVTLRQLPFTSQEAKDVGRVAKQNGWRVIIRSGSNASEDGLRQAKKGGIIHLATHAFYLPTYGTELVPDDSAERGVGGTRRRPSVEKQQGTLVEAYRRGSVETVKTMSASNIVLDDPMLQSGVALAGAQDTLEAWRNAKVPRMAQDGVLTAEESAMLDLAGTWLVTLSSCDSGLGEAEPGEGIAGLRRGFLQAGAQNVLTTLWPVNDALTASLMTAFYRKAFSSGDAPAALAEVQRQFLIRLRKTRGLQNAVTLAGAFVITTRVLQQ